MKNIDKDLLRQALLRMIEPFLKQGTETLFFSRNDAGDRYYVGAIPAAHDSATGKPPTYQCRRTRAELSDDAIADILSALETPATETFPKMSVPKVTWITVVLRCRERRLLASVRSGSRIRTIRYRWAEKEPTIVPLSNWTDAVMGECEFQDKNPAPSSPLAAFMTAKKKR